MSEQAEVTHPSAAQETEMVADPPAALEAEGSAKPAGASASADSGDTPADAGPAVETAAAAEPPAPPEPEAPASAPTEPEVQAAAEPEAAPVAEAPAAAEAVADTVAETPSPEAEVKVEAEAAPTPEVAAASTTPVAEAPAEAAGEEAAATEPEEPEEPTEHDLEVLALRHAKEQRAPVEGRVIGWNQGGFHVVVGTITAFCPRSEMEIKNPRSPNFYLDKTFEFHVIKHQKRGRRIVLSRKSLLMDAREQLAAELRPKLVPGADLTGRISSLTDFGAFVDLGGLEGLVHVTELSPRRVKHPREVVKVGDEVTVRVLRVEEDGDRISLSMKALQPNPWEGFNEKHPRGSAFEGKVVRKTDFGIFVELEPGLDGMVHLSQLPPGKSLSDAALEVGQTVAGWVLKTEPERERISLSLRQVPTEDPWKSVAERYPEGSTVEGEVEDVASFGVFVMLEPGLTGLLPNSESGVPRGQDVGKQYPAGKKVRLQIGNVDISRRRISLALEGATVEGSRTDYKDYVRQQKSQTSGMSVMEAAFAKLKQNQE